MLFGTRCSSSDRTSLNLSWDPLQCSPAGLLGKTRRDRLLLTEQETQDFRFLSHSQNSGWDVKHVLMIGVTMFINSSLTYINGYFLFAFSRLLAKEVEFWTRFGEPRKPAQIFKRTKFLLSFSNFFLYFYNKNNNKARCPTCWGIFSLKMHAFLPSEWLRLLQVLNNCWWTSCRPIRRPTHHLLPLRLKCLESSRGGVKNLLKCYWSFLTCVTMFLIIRHKKLLLNTCSLKILKTHGHFLY